MPLKKLANKKILILGLGNEGWSTYQFLRQHLPDLLLTVADRNLPEQFPPEQQKALQQKTNTTWLLGEKYLEKVPKFDVIFKTPGIPSTLPEIQAALKNGAQLTSNTQLFFELCPAKIIGVTGTKGKSTTSAVIHHILKEHGLDVLLMGNIGQVALSQLEKINRDTLVVFELSSHQLETLTLSPQIAVVQNITTEHLDYYSSTEEYQLAKAAITKFQTADDLVIYDPEFTSSASLAALSQGKHLRYSLTEGPDSVAFIRNDTIMRRDSVDHVTAILKIVALPLLGKHNLFNVLPGVIVGGLFNVGPEEIGRALREFKPLPHRLEFVLEKQAVRYYDDSLATTPMATIRALENFDEPVVLIAGGYERHQDFAELATVILERKVVGLVLFKPTGERLAEAVKQVAGPHSAVPAIEFAQSMSVAVAKAHAHIAPTGGVMLLSPGSASFGTFKDYHDRGEQFKTAVREL